MSAGKARSLPKNGAPERCLTGVGLGLTRKYSTRLEYTITELFLFRATMYFSKLFLSKCHRNKCFGALNNNLPLCLKHFTLSFSVKRQNHKILSPLNVTRFLSTDPNYQYVSSLYLKQLGPVLQKIFTVVKNSCCGVGWSVWYCLLPPSYICGQGPLYIVETHEGRHDSQPDGIQHNTQHNDTNQNWLDCVTHRKWHPTQWR
jgi:hypothetical protein